MNILFTGASSFTGHWFMRELAAAGHNITAVFLRREKDYTGLRAWRVDNLPACRRVFNCAFGSRRFIRVINRAPGWDMLCHHAAEVRDYKSPHFNAVAAAAHNTHNIAAVLDELGARGGKKILLTGTVFERGEGGEKNAQALSPYGLSKTLTTECFQFYAAQRNMRLGRFVIPNPFGPWEEPRFTAHLLRCWRRGEVATVLTPDYLRDNIHVSLLAKEYARFARTLRPHAGASVLRPSGYVETQGRFARRVAREMKKRVHLPCLVKLQKQTDFSEPHTRINQDQPNAATLGWCEKKAWDDMAAFYRHLSL